MSALRLSVKSILERAQIIEALDRLPEWSAEEFCYYYNYSIHWLYQRTGPKARCFPKIPTIADGKIRLNRIEVKEVMTQYHRAQKARQNSSLKNQKFGKTAAQQTPKTERILERLW